MENIIEMKHLSCKAGRRYLLKDIDWQVKKGEHWVVFGMNGSGKTTLLSIIAGFKPYDEGELKVFGQAYSAENILANRRRIGWVSSSFFDRYYTKESALNIVLAGKFGTLGLRGDVTDTDVKKAKALLQEMGIGDKLNQSFQTMSKGERQNVLIARALMVEPEILVMDEPCTGLDILARDHLLAMVRDFAQHTAMTIIYVTHYTEEIIDVFDQGLLLKAGRVVATGQRQDLFTAHMMSRFLDETVEILPLPHNQFKVQLKDRGC